jgi:pyruvate dehydrogenase E2 component (dihydrolipoamide acetyltransferase)
MATKVFMEALSPTMEEGRLVKWAKAEGDAVKSGDVLAEVETDKAIMELVARGDGILRKRMLDEGGTSPVGTLIAVIAGKDEDIESLVAGASSATPAAAPSPSAPAPSAPAAAAPPAPGAPSTPPVPPPRTQAPAAAPGATQRTRSSPLARRLAAERGVDLASLGGSGPGGRIIKRDVEGAPGMSAAPAGARAPVRAATDGDYRDVPLTQIRKTIARRLSESIGPIPTFYLTAEFDLERASEMRTAMAELGDEYKVSFNDIVLKAVATALAQHPECNAHWLGDHIRYFNRVHIGMAVAIEEGLITPVIFDADQKGLREIAAEAR